VTVSLEAQQLDRLDKITLLTRIPRSVLMREAIDGILAKYDPVRTSEGETLEK
jgi:metal-responsive CopG/Arc/MetJ family transcriptional regulator